MGGPSVFFLRRSPGSGQSKESACMLVCACEGARNDGCCWWVGRVDQVEDLDPAALEDVCTPTAGQHAPAAASDAPGSDADSQAAQRSPKRPRTSQAGEVAAPASVFTKARAVYSAGWEAAGEWPSRSCRCCSSLPACLHVPPLPPSISCACVSPSIARSMQTNCVQPVPWACVLPSVL